MFTTNEVGEAINQTFAIIGYFVTVLLVAIALAFTYEKLADSYRKWRKRRSPSYIPEGMFTWPSSIFTVNETRRARGVGPVIPAWPAKMGEDKDGIYVNGVFVPQKAKVVSDYLESEPARESPLPRPCYNPDVHQSHLWVDEDAFGSVRKCGGVRQYPELWCGRLLLHDRHVWRSGVSDIDFRCPGDHE